MPTYKPNYDDRQILTAGSKANISGKSPMQNLAIEEGAQREVAESETWLLARKQNMQRDDSKAALEALGFTILGIADDLFFKVQPPAGWTKETEGYWTTVKDAEGHERISQFFKGAWYDREAFLSIRK